MTYMTIDGPCALIIPITTVKKKPRRRSNTRNPQREYQEQHEQKYRFYYTSGYGIKLIHNILVHSTRNSLKSTSHVYYQHHRHEQHEQHEHGHHNQPSQPQSQS
ncbi:hypothetical protein BO71DRAFT_234472 [Aspergillus ellipticus CBS 707.79]|uniref:Uncharacterized protein n=1 Tax=Aspergillus ellipticus CBS 707.79 TaxID=1448320 RepID=A0A319EEH4_9EURO|nr:hypothetical protein BO71DRAFT_234472 [Aspergillus ellipticus CBS 707.79]